MKLIAEYTESNLEVLIEQDKNTNKRVLNPIFQKLRSCKYFGNLKVQ